MLHLAVHVALGRPWLGRQVLQTPVLYCEADVGRANINARLNLILHGLNVKRRPPVYIASNVNWQFPDENERDLLAYSIYACHAGLVVIDPLALLGPIGWENDLTTLRRTFDLLHEVVWETGVPLLILHHLNKRGSYRGVSALKGLVDTMILLSSNPHTPIVHAHTPKTRSVAGQRFAARMHVHPPGPAPDLVQFHLLSDSDPAADSSRQSQSVPTQVINHLILHGPASRPDLHSALGHLRPNSINRALARLVAQGILLRHAGLFHPQ
jgi:hypothetical protein